MISRRCLIGKDHLPTLTAHAALAPFFVERTLIDPTVSHPDTLREKSLFRTSDDAVILNVSAGAALALTEEPYCHRPRPRPNNRHPPAVVNYLEVVHISLLPALLILSLQLL